MFWTQRKKLCCFSFSVRQVQGMLCDLFPKLVYRLIIEQYAEHNDMTVSALSKRDSPESGNRISVKYCVTTTCTPRDVSRPEKSLPQTVNFYAI
mgnify:FL=1